MSSVITVLFLNTLFSQTNIINTLPNINNKLPHNLLYKRDTNIAASVSWRDDNNRDKIFSSSIATATTINTNAYLVHLILKGSYEWENGSDKELGTIEHLRFRVSPSKVYNSCLIKDRWIDRLHIETFAQHEHDRFRALNSRALSGLGVAILGVSDESIRVMTGTAYMLEFIDFVNNDSELNHRISNYIQAEVEVIERVDFKSTMFIQVKIDDPYDHLIMIAPDLSIKILEWLSVRLNLGIDYDSKPPLNVKKLGTAVKSEVLLKF